MNKTILRELMELREAGVITSETAERIEQYYRLKSDESPNRSLIIFGILGAILVGLGIILILAHNWDMLSRATKSIFAFLPLLLGQFFCGYTLLRKADSTAWRESSAAFLFFAVGASIALISQIYNLPGSMTTFTLTWMLLCLPLVYLMPSSIVSLLYIIGITWYGTDVAYWLYPHAGTNWYWVLLLLVVPHYFLLWRRNPYGNFLLFHNWMLPISVITMLGSFSTGTAELMFPSYMSLFGILYLIGNLPTFYEQPLVRNGFIVLGSLGTIYLLLFLSFDLFWLDLALDELEAPAVFLKQEFIVSIVLSLIGGGLFFYLFRDKSLERWNPIGLIFLAFLITFWLGVSMPMLAVVLVNILIFIIGLATVRRGIQFNHLGILNYGLLIITALIICRFFDVNINFILKGLLFVAVGIGFFVANYRMVQYRKSHAQNF